MRQAQGEIYIYLTFPTTTVDRGYSSIPVSATERKTIGQTSNEGPQQLGRSAQTSAFVNTTPSSLEENTDIDSSLTNGRANEPNVTECSPDKTNSSTQGIISKVKEQSNTNQTTIQQPLSTLPSEISPTVKAIAQETTVSDAVSSTNLRAVQKPVSDVVSSTNVRAVQKPVSDAVSSTNLRAVQKPVSNVVSSTNALLGLVDFY